MSAVFNCRFSLRSDPYDDDMSALTSRMFGTSSARQHGFDYAEGRLSSLTGGTINYGFEYAANTGDISGISKNGAVMENHTYSINNGETIVSSYYPSSDSALYTETKVLDKYGRLKGIDGVLETSYDLNPYWYYIDSSNQTHTTMESYNRATHGALSQVTKGMDGKDAMLSQTSDTPAGEVTKYGYDDGKLTAAVTSDMANNLRRQQTFVYDDADRLTRIRLDHNPATNEYVTSDITYVKAASDPDADRRVSNYSFKINGTQKAKTVNTYDTYKRVTKKTYTVGSKTFTKEIVYDKTKVSKVVDSVGGTTQYEYDSMGRISKEKDSSGNILRSFSYDTYGQLVRENNAELDKTFVFEYNNGGITKVKEYAYSTSSTPTGTATEKTNTYDSTYPDRLTKCGSTSISYNSMGCPTTCNGYTATWTRGKLSKLSKGLKTAGMHTYNYTYNAFGQRIGINYVYTAGTSSSSAVVMGMLTSYSHTFRYDRSGRLIYESTTTQYYGEGSGTKKTVYLYDESGIIGMLHTSESGTTAAYYFARNLLGDVIGIYNTSGTKVGGYAYDAWGNCTITLNTNGIATRNPIRYRGYYYDEDTKLYYLNARYYCPEWRRFISPDDTGYLDPATPNGLNLYAYCNNDPVNYADPSGNSVIASLLIGFAISSLIGWGLSQMFGSQIAGGIGSISGGATAISTGISLCALGPWGIVAGVALIAVGGLTIAFGANEIVDGATGTNYIQDWTGWSDNVYNGVYTGLNIASAVGSIAGNVYLNAIRANALKGLDDAVYGPKASQHIGERSYYDSKLTMREIVKYGKIRKAKYGVPGYEFRIKGYSVMGKSGNIHRGIWSLVYGKGFIWHFLLG